MATPLELVKQKRVDRALGAVLTLAAFVIETGVVPQFLKWAAGILVVLWLTIMMLRAENAPRENIEYALARIAEQIAVLVAALALWAARVMLPATAPIIDPRLIVTLLLCLVAAGFMGAFAYSVARGEPIEVRSQWGGLGGSGGGWRISKPMVCLIGAVVFGGLTALANLPLTPDAGKNLAGAETKGASDTSANKGTVTPPEQKPAPATPGGAASEKK